MKKVINEALLNETINRLAHAKHGDYSFINVQMFLQNLHKLEVLKEEKEEPKPEEKEDGKQE